MEIQRLGIHEGTRLRTIRLRSLRDAPNAFNSTLEETLARSPEEWAQQVRDMATFVALVGKQDVGIVRGALDSDDPSRSRLLSMWVAPASRGEGIGEALVGAIIEWARSTPASRLLLDVSDDNHPAIALYQRLGFAPNGEAGSFPPPREHILEHQREYPFGLLGSDEDAVPDMPKGV